MKAKITVLTVFFLLVQTFYGQEAAQGSGTSGEKSYSMWGAYIGLGYVMSTGNRGEYFTGQIDLPITIDYSYKNLLAQLNLDGGWGKVAKTMTFSDGKTWNEGDNVFSNALGLNLGFSVYNTAKTRITPYAGYSLVYMSKKWWSGSDISQHEPDNYYYNFGLLFDLKNVFGGSEGKYDPYAALRITIGYYMQAQDDQYPQYYDGDIFYISVGVTSLGDVQSIFD